MTATLTNLIGFAASASSSAASVVLTDNSVLDNVTDSVFTFSTQSFGTASAERLIAVGVGANTSNISSMTIGGIAATEIVTVANANEGAEIWIAAVPTGATGDVVITFATSVLRDVGISVWALYNASPTATNSGSDSDSDPATFDLDIAASGVAIAYLFHRANSATTYTWTNLTEDVDELVETDIYFQSAASAAFATAQTNLTITGDASQAGVRSPCMVTASFPRL